MKSVSQNNFIYWRGFKKKQKQCYINLCEKKKQKLLANRPGVREQTKKHKQFERHEFVEESVRESEDNRVYWEMHIRLRADAKAGVMAQRREQMRKNKEARQERHDGKRRRSTTQECS